jgi:hypothetical protein
MRDKKMKLKPLKISILWGVVFCIIITSFKSYSQSIDKQQLRQYFQEAKLICDKDRNKLWGIYLYGPFLFVDPKTRTVYANTSDKENTLKPEGDILIGKLPEKYNIANTSFIWNGMRWTMVILPVPTDKYERTSLMIHELWHRIQDSIGFPGSNPSNSHLDTKDGRILLQMEWRALKKALLTKNDDRIKSINDALIFRIYRREIFPKSGNEEIALEMNEGLAEYTGLKLAAETDADLINAIVKRIDESSSRPTFVRSFAYISGPAYCYLLDEFKSDWRSKIKSKDDLGNELKKITKAVLPQNLNAEVEKKYGLYDGESIIKNETKIEADKIKIIADYKKRFVSDPVLIIPLQNMNVQFNPNTQQPLDTLGTIYPTIRVTDNWGILTVTDGALMSPTWSKICVPVPQDTTGSSISGAGYKIELGKGWKIVPAERKGDYKVNYQ